MHSQDHKKAGGRLRKHGLLIFLECVLVASFIALGLLIVDRVAAANRIRTEEAASKELFLAMEQQEQSASAAEADPAVPPKIAAEIEELMAQNADAVGLLHFEADKTLYVCQTEDNAYYMTHRFDGSEDPAGMIYMDFRNSLWPRSDNLILYGHNMRNGSRFGTLKRFEKEEYILQYPVFQFAEKFETVNYVPFAVFHTTVIQDAPEYYAFDRIDFADESEFNGFVKDVRSRSVVDIPIDVAYGDKLLTLVTCHSGLERGRLVIVLREEKAEDTFFSEK